MMTLLRRSAERARADEGGFTLVELIVAMVITLLVMSALLSVFVGSLGTVARAKQRQTATALATQVMERLRALPYDTVTAGSSSGSVTFPNITGTPPRLRPAAIAGVDELLVVNTMSPARRTERVENVDYDVKTYVSKSTATGGEQAYMLTVLVDWSSNVSGGARTAVQRSTVYSAAGCLSTAQRPFSGPCQAYFTAQAGQAAAGISVTNADDSAQDIPGFGGTKVELGLPVLSTNLLLEQTTSATGSVATTQGRTTTGGTVATSGGVPGSAAVDSDPSSTADQTATATTATQTASSRSVTGSAGTLTVRPSDSDTGTSSAAVAAEPSLCRGADSTAAQLTTGTPVRRPCVSASVQPLGAAGSIVHDLSSAGFPGVTTELARVAPAPSQARAVAAHLTTSNPTACTTGTGAGGVGCAHAEVSRALGDVSVGALPAVVSRPSGFTTAWSLTGLTETARAERGTGARTPSYIRSGTLRYWTGTTYQTLNLGSVTTPTTVSSATVSGTNGTLDVTVESSVTVNPWTTSMTGPADCKSAACVAQASAPGTVRGQTVYTVTVGGVQLTRFVVVTDLGGLVAQSSFKAAPDA